MTAVAVDDSGAGPGLQHLWPALLLMLVLFTPKVVLPGGVPIRLDDFVSFFALGSPVGGAVGAKEYLDALRPLKFLAVFHVTRRLAHPDVATRGFVRVLAAATVAGTALALAQ